VRRWAWLTDESNRPFLVDLDEISVIEPCEVLCLPKIRAGIEMRTGRQRLTRQSTGEIAQMLGAPTRPMLIPDPPPPLPMVAPGTLVKQGPKRKLRPLWDAALRSAREYLLLE